MAMNENDDIIQRLAEVPAGLARRVSIEMTSRCNLRCTYCSVPHAPEYGAQDIDDAMLQKVVALVSGKPVRFLSLSARGELTYMKDWTARVLPFLNCGIPLHAVTNLSAPLSWDEAGVLARFGLLHTSIDTVDFDLARRIRKGNDLRSVQYNINLIRAAAIAHGHPPPRIEVIGVVNESSATGLRNLAALVIACGANGLHLQDLVFDYSDQVSEPPIGHISHLPVERLAEIALEITQARDLLGRHGCSFNASPGLYTLLSDALEGHPPVVASVEIHSPVHGRYKRTAKRPGPGQTRACTEPWELTMFLAAGTIQTCCGGREPSGDVAAAGSVDDLVNAPEQKDLRRQLLTGELDDYCAICPMAPIVEVADFQASIAQFLGNP